MLYWGWLENAYETEDKEPGLGVHPGWLGTKICDQSSLQTNPRTLLES